MMHEEHASTVKVTLPGDTLVTVTGVAYAGAVQQIWIDSGADPESAVHLAATSPPDTYGADCPFAAWHVYYAVNSAPPASMPRDLIKLPSQVVDITCGSRNSEGTVWNPVETRVTEDAIHGLIRIEAADCGGHDFRNDVVTLKW